MTDPVIRPTGSAPSAPEPNSADARNPVDRTELDRALTYLNILTEPGDRRTAARVCRAGAITALAHLRLELAIAGNLAASQLHGDAVLAQAHDHGISVITFGSRSYPAALLDLAEPPLALWALGDLTLLPDLPGRAGGGVTRCDVLWRARRVRLVSRARAARDRGGLRRRVRHRHCGSPRGPVRRRGTDRDRLRQRSDRAYPPGNHSLFERVAAQGLLLSEAAPGRVPTRSRFLARNRLIAALSGATVVIEAARRSGAINTADWCRTLGRPIMAVPGPVTSTTSTGVHELLRVGARLVTSVDDITEVLPAP